MATQTGTILFEGTIGNITGYRMNGKYYLKTKSSLSRKKILSHNCFSNTRRNAKWFGEAQTIAKQIYHELSPGKRDQHKIWYPLRNKAQLLVREELPREEIIRQLRSEFVTPPAQQSKQPLLRPVIVHNPNKEMADEIFVGREINSGVERSLIDQLAASRAFVQTLLSTGIGAGDMINRLSPQRAYKVNKKLRR